MNKPHFQSDLKLRRLLQIGILYVPAYIDEVYALKANDVAGHRSSYSWGWGAVARTQHDNNLHGKDRH